MKHDLDPDFRPKLKRDKAGKLVPCCAKCRQRVDPLKCRKAWVNWETHCVSLVREEIVDPPRSPDVIAEEYIGPECWKIIGLPKI